MMTCFPERAAFYAQYKKGAGDFSPSAGGYSLCHGDVSLTR